MKKLIILTIFVLSMVLLVACGGETSTTTPATTTTTEPAKLTISGVTLADKTVVYNGEAQTLTLDGTLPEGVKATMTYGDQSVDGVTDAGEYTVKAVLVGEGYETLMLTAKLTISPATLPMDQVAMENLVVNYSGETFTLTVQGLDTLPKGVTVEYLYTPTEGEGKESKDGAVEEGTYTVKATLSLKNYKTETLEATLEIQPKGTLANLAKTVMNAFGKAPDIWEFLPEKMGLEDFVFEGTLPDYSKNVTVSSLPDVMIGKQLGVVYSSFTAAQKTLSYVNTVYSGLSAIADIYQQYINKNPEHYREFEGTWSIFAIRIELTDGSYTLLAKASGVTVELYCDPETRAITGRASVADVATVKFESDDEHLRYAMTLGSLRTVDVEFVRNDKATVGYLYETTGVGDKRLTTASMISITEDYTVVVGNKGDFLVPGQGINVEIYNSKTGSLIGTEVYETIKLVDYDTVWYPLSSITGIDSVKVVFDQSSEDNAMNPDTIFINGSATAFKPAFNTKLFVKTSRHFDIEMKTVLIFTYDAAKDAYVETEVEIPMFFVQRDNLDEYLAEMKKENGMTQTPTNTTSAVDDAIIEAAYQTHTEAYNKIKDALTYEQTIAFVGTANTWFTSAK